MSDSPPQLSPSRASAIMNMRRAEEGDYVLTCLLAGSCHWPSSSLFNLLFGKVSVTLVVVSPFALRERHPRMIIQTEYSHCGLDYAGVEVWNRCSPPLPLLRSCSTFFSAAHLPPPLRASTWGTWCRLEPRLFLCMFCHRARLVTRGWSRDNWSLIGRRNLVSDIIWPLLPLPNNPPHSSLVCSKLQLMVGPFCSMNITFRFNFEDFAI